MAAVAPTAPQPQTMLSATVPAGIGPGMPFVIQAPNGENVMVTCPVGASAGQQCQVPYDAPPEIQPVAAEPSVVIAERSFQVDHLMIRGCPPIGEMWVMYTDGKADLATEITSKMVLKNMGCCKNPLNGLEIPIYTGTVDKTGQMQGSRVATMLLEFPLCVAPGCHQPMSAVVKRDAGSAVLGRLDSTGIALCPQCCEDDPLHVTLTGAPSVDFAGTTIPCCICPNEDVEIKRPVHLLALNPERSFLTITSSPPAPPPRTARTHSHNPHRYAVSDVCVLAGEESNLKFEFPQPKRGPDPLLATAVRKRTLASSRRAHARTLLLQLLRRPPLGHPDLHDERQHVRARDGPRHCRFRGVGLPVP